MAIGIEHLIKKQPETKNGQLSCENDLSLFESQVAVTGKIIKTLRINHGMSPEEIFKQMNILPKT
jgi:hypothetical protein